MTERLGYPVAEYAAMIGRENTSRIYAAIERGEIPWFIAPGTTRPKLIPAAWVEEQIASQVREHGAWSGSKSAPPTHQSLSEIARDRAALAGGGTDPRRSIQ